MISTSFERELELFERHVDVLIAIKKNQPIGIIKLANIMEMPSHKVRYSLRILEKEGYINATPEGAVITDEAISFLDSLPDYLDRYIGMLQEIKANLCDKY